MVSWGFRCSRNGGPVPFGRSVLRFAVIVVAATVAVVATAAAAATDATSTSYGGYSLGYHPSEANLVAPLLPPGAVALPVAAGDTLGRPETGAGLLAAVSLRAGISSADAAASDLVAVPAGFSAVCVNTVRGSRVQLTVAQLANLVLGDVVDDASYTAQVQNGRAPAPSRRRQQQEQQRAVPAAPTPSSDKRRQVGGPGGGPGGGDGTLPPLPPGGTFPPLAPGETLPPLPPGETLPPDALGGDDTFPPGDDTLPPDDVFPTPPGATASSGPASQRTTLVLIPNTTVFRRALARGFRVGGVSFDRVPSAETLPAAAFGSPHVRWVPSVDELEALSYEAAAGSGGTTAAFNLVLSIGNTNVVDCVDVVAPRVANETVSMSVGTNAYLALNLYARESAGAYEIPAPELSTNISSDYVFWSPLSIIVNRSALCRVGTRPLRTLLLTFYGGTAAVETMEWQLVAGLDEEPRLRAIAIINGIAQASGSCLDAQTGGPSFPFTSDGSVRSMATGLGLQYFAEDNADAVAPEHRTGAAGVSTIATVAASAALVGVTTAIATAAVDTSNLRQVPLASTLLVLEANFGVLNDASTVSPVTQFTIPSCVIVGIFNGSVTRWNDAAIVEPNFGVQASTFPNQPIHLVLDTATGIAATLLLSLRNHEVAVCGAAAPSVAASPEEVQQRLGASRVTLVGTMHDAIYRLLNDIVYGFAVWTEAEARGVSIATATARYSAYTVVPSVRGLELVARAEYLIDVYNRGARLDPATMEVVIDDGSTVTPVYPFAATMYLVYQHDVSTAAFRASSAASAARQRRQASGDEAPTQALDCAGVRSAMDFMIWSITARRAAGHVSNENLLWLGGFDASVAQAAIQSSTCDGAPVYPELLPAAALNLGAVIGGVVAGTVAVGGTIAAVIFLVVLRAKTRDVGYAPRDAEQPFAVAFTDVESSTTLWARNAGAMAVGLDLHHALMRRAIAARRCYEVKTIGDAFMVACTSAGSLLDFALDVQELLFDATYPADGPADVFDRIYRDKRQEAMAEAAAEAVGGEEGEPSPYAGDPSLKDPQLYDRLWRGLRVRIGLHYGKGDIAFDEVAKGYDYYGSVVNAASRVESSGHGGQCVCTAAFVVAAGLLGDGAAAPEVGDDGQPVVPDEGTHGDVAWALKGSAVLRGFDAPIKLYQVGRPRFADRFFPPLKVDAPKAQMLVDAQAAADGDHANAEANAAELPVVDTADPSPNGEPTNPLATTPTPRSGPGPAGGIGDDLSSVGSMGSGAFAAMPGGGGGGGPPVLDLGVPRESRVSAAAYWIDAAMSAAQPSERRAMLAAMCRAWRLPAVERGAYRAGSRQEATAHRRCLAGLALRLVLIAEEQQQRRPHHQNQAAGIVDEASSASFASFRMRGRTAAAPSPGAPATATMMLKSPEPLSVAPPQHHYHHQTDDTSDDARGAAAPVPPT